MPIGYLYQRTFYAVFGAVSACCVPAMTMRPICIAAELKHQGYGKILLDYSIQKAKEMGAGALCFEGNEGNIDFYGKSG